jgi:hypothetical protein
MKLFVLDLCSASCDIISLSLETYEKNDCDVERILRKWGYDASHTEWMLADDECPVKYYDENDLEIDTDIE